MKLSFPHPLIIMLVFIGLATMLTYVVPAGSYSRVLDEATGREIVVQGSYKQHDNNPVGIGKMFLSIPEGFIEGAEVVVLILIIGGAFYVVEKTGAFSRGLEVLIFRFNNAKSFLTVIIGVLFAAMGNLSGFQEEVIAMVPLLMVLSTKIGYSKTAVIAFSLGSAVIGGSFGPTNPFGVIIAQKVAEVPVFSGSLYRLVFLALALGFWITYFIKTGKDNSFQMDMSDKKPESLSNSHIIILVLVALTFGFMVYGLTNLDWNYNEMSAIFFVLGLAAGLIGNLGINGTARAYSEGFGELIFAGVIVGMARSIYLIMQEGQIIDTIILGLFSPLEGLPLGLSAVSMLVGQCILHIPVPSTSGQAVLTMPLLAPIADLIGMSRQVVVLAYQYGAGLMDLVTPTNGALMAILAASGISYKDWMKATWKPTLILLLIGMTSIVLGIFVFS
ncbi:YfcC family protein [Cognataquiflexum rubidum]|uniref:YfcC family protein n=1 Tax=Cognataquiflexum rubidum TaxID=2922273 RepID=UPI001F131F5D|nr:YfcC family protein [Cognataquiflexum rubidum]MCH6233592.1 YfcC family protein [Cognataquiflexum rubidum]